MFKISVTRSHERVLCCAGHVLAMCSLNEGNIFLSDEELEMLVVLRMNREFMKFMRKNYGELSHPRSNILDDAVWWRQILSY